MKSPLYTLEMIFLAVLGLGLGLLSFGFFFPDPFYYGPTMSRPLKVLLLLLRFGIPLAGLLLISGYLLVRSKKIRFISLLIGIGSVVLPCLLLFPVIVSLYYIKSGPGDLASYHPYLQLAPHEVEQAKLTDTSSFRIVCLGGSTTAWGPGELHQGKGWPAQLEEELRAKTGKTITVLNQGKEWYTSLHSLINYETNIRPFKPNLIIVMHNINDLLHNADFSYFSGGDFREDYGHFYGPLTRLIQHRGFFAATKEALRAAWWYPARKPLRTEEFQGLPAFKRNLSTIAELAQLDGTKVLFMTEPYLYHEGMTQEELTALTMVNTEAIGPSLSWDAETAWQGMKKYNQAIAEVSQSKNTLFFDLAQQFIDQKKQSLEFFSDDVHYKEEAYPFVLENVTGAVLQSGVLP